MASWEEERADIASRVADLRRRGECPTCYDLETGDLYGKEGRLVHEDDALLVLLERFPRIHGHTIVVYKPHREDLSELSDHEAALVFSMALRVTHAIKAGLGAEKVYLNTMCDGSPNHFHLQLLPRYAGDSIGSTRFVLPRGPLEGAKETLASVRAHLSA
jgi:histidine triad (HIT) family protein